MGSLLLYEDVQINWNNTDTIVIVCLAVFALIGLLFGANRLGGQIVGQFVAVLGGMALANIVLPYLASMDWYKSVVTALWNNTQLVSWIFYILLSAVFYLLINLLWRLVILRLIDSAKSAPVLSRLLGLLLGVMDWAILLVITCILFAALPGWLGQNAPEWVTNADHYLSSSQIGGYLVPLFKQLLYLLGIVKA
jgi:hypothetical protein